MSRFIGRTSAVEQSEYDRKLDDLSGPLGPLMPAIVARYSPTIPAFDLSEAIDWDEVVTKDYVVSPVQSVPPIVSQPKPRMAMADLQKLIKSCIDRQVATTQSGQTLTMFAPADVADLVRNVCGNLTMIVEPLVNGEEQ